MNEPWWTFEQEVLIQVAEWEMPFSPRKSPINSDATHHSFPIENPSMYYIWRVMRCAFLDANNLLIKEDYLPVPNLSIKEFPDDIVFSSISERCTICHEAGTVTRFLESYFSRWRWCVHTSPLCNNRESNVLWWQLYRIERFQNWLFIGAQMNLVVLATYRWVVNVMSSIN